MSDKDQLLKQQREEIEKLKKELQDASKPSSMFSVFKNTMKRNVHDFFIREDKMKTMDSKIKAFFNHFGLGKLTYTCIALKRLLLLKPSTLSLSLEQ